MELFLHMGKLAQERHSQYKDHHFKYLLIMIRKKMMSYKIINPISIKNSIRIEALCRDHSNIFFNAFKRKSNKFS